jgi:regulator of cell morphogenesis and NO signaling
MKNIDDKTVAEIVTENIKTADVFKRNGIDFCCNGNVSVMSVCNKKGVDYNKLKEEIISINDQPSDNYDFKAWDLDKLVDFIIETHHKYVLEASVIIIDYSDKVARVHGHHYAEVIEINKLFHEIVAELKMHMHKEELILFPYIKQMAKTKKNDEKIEKSSFGDINNPVSVMESEHDNAGEIIKKIAELSNDFKHPVGACNTFRALYAKLEEFRNDIFQHIHLENNILFPRAIALEKELST